MEVQKSEIIEILESIVSEDVLLEEVERKVGEVQKVLSEGCSHTHIGNTIYKQIYSVRRFEGKKVNPCPIMYYRDYVGIHLERIKRLGVFSQFIIAYVFPGENFDFTYFHTFNGRHDEIEAVSPFGDIPTPIKELLTQRQKSIVSEVEKRIESIICQDFPSSTYCHNSEKMKSLFEDTRTKESLESQVSSYLDKLDGMMTALHEVIAGNKDFIFPLKNYLCIMAEILSGNKLRLLQPLFFLSSDAYKGYLEELHDGHPEIIARFQEAIDLFDLHTIVNLGNEIEKRCEIGKLHSEETLGKSFGVPSYLAWKKGIGVFDKENQRIKVGDTFFTHKEHLITVVEQ